MRREKERSRGGEREIKGERRDKKRRIAKEKRRGRRKREGEENGKEGRRISGEREREGEGKRNLIVLLLSHPHARTQERRRLGRKWKRRKGGEERERKERDKERRRGEERNRACERARDVTWEREILSPLFFFFSIPLFSMNLLDINIYIYIIDKSMSLKYPKNSINL